jgi:enoyl-CoA hydratase/carnithine racemase
MSATVFQLEERDNVRIVRLRSDDGTNRLTRECVLSLAGAVEHLAQEKRPIVFTGTTNSFLRVQS